MIRVAVLGTGAWGLNHLRVVLGSERSELAAIIDPDPAARDRARALAPGVPCFADPDRALGDPAIDAIVIASPSATHVSLALAGLRANKHVLVEKPLGLSMADVQLVAGAAAQRAECTVMVGHLMVFHPAVERMRALYQEGVLGALRYLRSSRANLGRVRPDESVLWTLGPHELSMLDFVLGASPASVSAVGRCLAHPGSEDVVLLTLHYAGGAIAQLHLSRVHPRKERSLTLVGEQRTVDFDDLTPTKLVVSGDALPSGPARHDEPLQLQFQHFLTCIERRERPRTGIESALRVTAALVAAQRSLASGGTAERVG